MEKFKSQSHPFNLTLQSDVETLLSSCEEWKFDCFKLNEVTNGMPLSTLGFYLLKKQGLVERYKIKENKLINFLKRIEQGYPDNPYHNRIHAADVLQSMHVIMTRGGLYPKHIDSFQQFAGYISAIIHDYEHGGVNNDFLTRTRDLLAIRYNDKSPLENHHLSGSFFVLYHPDCNFMCEVTRDRAQYFRSCVIEMVLATDMKQHFYILSQFQTKIKDKCDTDGILPDSLTDQDIMLILQMALKCSDVGHLTAPVDVHKRWVALLEEEFFRQGDLEKQLELDVSPLMDRKRPGITKSQAGFFDIVALPLFRAFTSVFRRSQPLIISVEQNFQVWKEYEAQCLQQTQ